MSFMDVVKNHLEGNCVNYSNTEALYLSKPFSEKSSVRHGQPRFENGGLLDEREFFCTNEQLVDEIENYLNGADPGDCSVLEMVDHLIEVFGGEDE